MSLFEIVLCNGQKDGFVWSVHDANTARTKHRIVGNFNHHLSKQNDQNKKKNINQNTMIVGLPFILNKFEVRLCFELNIAMITHKSMHPGIHKTQSNNKNHNILHQFFVDNNTKRIETLKQQCQYAKNKTQIEASCIGQKRKLTETDIVDTNDDRCRWNQYHQLKIQSTANIIHNALNTDVSLDKKMHIAPSENDFILFPNELFDVYTWSDIKNTYDPEIVWCKLFNFETAFEYRMFEEEYTMYRDLYHKGFYILIDRRFSGHFILYEESPSLSSESKIHSKYIVQIISRYDTNYKAMINVLDKYCKQTLQCEDNDVDKDTKLLELDIMIMCFVRVAVNVKKQMLFGYIDSETYTVRYYIVKWHYYKSKMNESDTNQPRSDDIEKEMWYQVYEDYKLVIT